MKSTLWLNSLEVPESKVLHKLYQHPPGQCQNQVLAHEMCSCFIHTSVICVHSTTSCMCILVVYITCPRGILTTESPDPSISQCLLDSGIMGCLKQSLGGGAGLRAYYKYSLWIYWKVIILQSDEWRFSNPFYSLSSAPDESLISIQLLHPSCRCCFSSHFAVTGNHLSVTLKHCCRPT